MENVKTIWMKQGKRDVSRIYVVQTTGFYDLKILKYAGFPFDFHFPCSQKILKTILMTSRKTRRL